MIGRIFDIWSKKRRLTRFPRWKHACRFRAKLASYILLSACRSFLKLFVRRIQSVVSSFCRNGMVKTAEIQFSFSLHFSHGIALISTFQKYALWKSVVESGFLVKTSSSTTTCQRNNQILTEKVSKVSYKMLNPSIYFKFGTFSVLLIDLRIRTRSPVLFGLACSGTLLRRLSLNRAERFSGRTMDCYDFLSALLSFFFCSFWRTHSHDSAA